MELHNLKPAEGSTRKNKRLGRGEGSGRGGTSTKGHKGAQSRTGYNRRPGFEGGQMPLYRRLPKFGFKNPFRVEYNVINLDGLQHLLESNPGLETIDHDFLKNHGLISKESDLVKVLGRGKISLKATIKLNKFSGTAKAAIEAAGGTAIEI